MFALWILECDPLVVQLHVGDTFVRRGDRLQNGPLLFVLHEFIIVTADPTETDTLALRKFTIACATKLFFFAAAVSAESSSLRNFATLNLANAFSACGLNNIAMVFSPLFEIVFCTV
jgi:hypothetical protein